MDEFYLIDDLGNDWFFPPFSHDGTDLNFDADHISAAVGITKLNARIVDNTSSAPEVLDITYSFVLYVEDGNEQPTVATNEC